MYYLISYDVEDDKIRLKISKVLEDYGHRVQNLFLNAGLRKNFTANSQPNYQKL